MRPRSINLSASLTQAKGDARAALTEAAQGRMSWESLSDDMRVSVERLVRAARNTSDIEAAARWLESREIGLALDLVIEEFLAEKEGSVDVLYLQTFAKDLERFKESVGDRRISEVMKSDMQEWLSEVGEGLGDKRRKDLRGKLVQLFKWARSKGYVAAAELTEADKLAPVRVGVSSVRVLSVDECKFLFQVVRPEFYGWLSCGLFLGLRPEEVAPRQARRDGGIRWEHFEWDFDCVRLPASIVKGGRRPRIIPLNDAAKSFLFPIRRESGRVCSKNAAEERETLRLGKLMNTHYGRDEGWPKDCLRHTYASARNAILRNLPQLAEEMGNSVKMLHDHYHNPQRREYGEEFFSLSVADTVRYDQGAILGASEK